MCNRRFKSTVCCDHCQGEIWSGVYLNNGESNSAWCCAECGCIWSWLGFRLIQPGPDCPTLSPVLNRLIEEVRNENPQGHAYDRAHNRHNR